jgi:hypothetical protein
MYKENLLIAAGTTNAKLINGEFQPYININGKTNIERVLKASLQAKNVYFIYIWGDVNKLCILLKDYLAEYPKKIILIEQKDCFVDSMVFAYLSSLNKNNLIPFLSSFKTTVDFNWKGAQEIITNTPNLKKTITLIMSDTPFVTSDEIDEFIHGKDVSSGIVLGRCRYRSVENIFEEDFKKDKAVKNLYSFIVDGKREDVILNSFFSGDLSSIDLNIWALIDTLHTNRTIIEGGVINFTKLKDNLIAFKQTFFDKNSKQTKSSKIKTLYFLTKSYYKIVKSKPISRFNDLNLIIAKIKKITNVDLNFYITDSPGSALDVDTKYEKDFYEKNFTQLQIITKNRYYSNSL